MEDCWKAFDRLHCYLPREGPGSDATTLEAIRRLPRLPDNPVILDLGCGPGRQTLVPAREFGVPITAVDFHEPCLARLWASAAEAGPAERITTRHQSFDSLTDTPLAEVKVFWDSAYPAITNVEGNRRIAEEAGFELADHFVLPGASWRNEYLTPAAERVEMLRPQAAADPMPARVLEEMDRELDITRRHGDTFSYVFFVLHRRE